jgi:hypothetical protein
MSPPKGPERILPEKEEGLEGEKGEQINLARMTPVRLASLLAWWPSTVALIERLTKFLASIMLPSNMVHVVRRSVLYQGSTSFTRVVT